MYAMPARVHRYYLMYLYGFFTLAESTSGVYSICDF